MPFLDLGRDCKKFQIALMVFPSLLSWSPNASALRSSLRASGLAPPPRTSAARVAGGYSTMAHDIVAAHTLVEIPLITLDPHSQFKKPFLLRPVDWSADAPGSFFSEREKNDLNLTA